MGDFQQTSHRLPKTRSCLLRCDSSPHQVISENKLCQPASRVQWGLESVLFLDSSKVAPLSKLWCHLADQVQWIVHGMAFNIRPTDSHLNHHTPNAYLGILTLAWLAPHSLSEHSSTPDRSNTNLSLKCSTVPDTRSDHTSIHTRNVEPPPQSTSRRIRDMESHQTSFRRAQNASYVGKGSLSMSADAFDVAQNE